MSSSLLNPIQISLNPISILDFSYISGISSETWLLASYPLPICIIPILNLDFLMSASIINIVPIFKLFFLYVYGRSSETCLLASYPLPIFIIPILNLDFLMSMVDQARHVC